MPIAKKPRTFLRRAAWALSTVVLATIFLKVLITFFIQTRRVPEALKKTPEALTIYERHAGVQASRDSRFVERPRWDSPEPPKDFDDYVRFQLERNPNDEGARLYLDLVGRFDAEFFKQRAIVFGSNSKKPWRPGDPLTDGQRQWLIARHDWIDEIRKMIAAGGPPLPRPGEISQKNSDSQSDIFYPNGFLYGSGGSILDLDAESQRLREAKDPSEAAAVLLDAYALGCEIFDWRAIGNLIAIGTRRQADQGLSAWLAGDPPESSILIRFRSALDGFHGVVRRRTWLAAEKLIETRENGIRLFDLPLSNWPDDRWLGGRRRGSGSPGFIAGLGGALFQIIERTYEISRMKANAGEIVREYDRISIQAMQQFQKPFSESQHAVFDEWRASKGPYFPFSRWTFSEYAARAAAGEAATNLNRSALRLLQEESPPPGLAGDPNADAWLDSPWRDPFTEAPLKIVDETSSTLIYSLGPDMRDQSGVLLYDPSNGTVSAGDLALRIPKGRTN